jgi:Flp pilus assembly protein TadG
VTRPSGSPLAAWITAFVRDTHAASAVEFAMLAGPFFVTLLCILQIGIYYFAQSALDNGVLETSQTLYTNFRTGTTATLPNASSLKTSVANNAGSMISNNSSLAVEIRPMTGLSSGTVAISDGYNDYGTTTSTLVLRAKTNVVTFAPFFSSIAVASSSAIVRRQGT